MLSCGTYRETTHGYKIKGDSKIIFNGNDTSLNGKSVISGYIYSRSLESFTEFGKLLVNQREHTVNQDGYFNIIVNPGTYEIIAKNLGDNEEKLKRVKLDQNTKIIILFELGTTAIY